jgi:nucleoside-diphosphate-sugar epimerase|tara:strand:- start:384 stop:1028 length:645 start_codon:yes stop_codon:yes gene_type:complete
MKILVAGSTGLVGKTLITDFLQEHEVIAISRRSFKFPNNVKQELIDFNKDFSLKPADHFFICLGYPLELLDLIYMRDKIKPKFEEVDFGLVIKLAKMALDVGIKDISVISSVMADKNSLNHYLKIKGEMEEEIKKLSFNKINIFRPSHLLGERENKIGLDVQIFEKVTNIFGQVLPSQLKDFKNVEARTLAKNMVTEAFNNKTGVSYFSHKDFN